VYTQLGKRLLLLTVLSSCLGKRVSNVGDQQFLNKAIYEKVLRDRADKLGAELELPTGENEVDPFLETVSEVESSNGKNTKHRILQDGIHKGNSAIGQYGIMPNTAKDAAKKIGNLQTDIGRYLQKVDLPKIRELAGLKPDQIKEKLKDPSIEQKLARILALEAKLKQRGDEERMGYNWNQGNNKTFEGVSDEEVQASPYVQKFKKAKSEGK
jgi:hypothetical protein